MSASITFTMPVASFHVFGSGSASCSLINTANGKRLHGVNPVSTDNGFVGYVTETVTLYRNTPVKYVKSAYPGGSFKFEGTWEELVTKIVGAKFSPAFAGANPGRAAANLTREAAEALAALVVGAQVQEPEFESWHDQPRWAVVVGGREPIRV